MNSSSSAFDTSSFDTSSTDAGSAPTRHCIVCDGHMERCFIKHGYWIVECKLCGHRSTELEPQADHVTSVYADDYFEGGGAGYTNYLEEGEILKDRGRRYGKLLSAHTQPGRVLDVGAAAGFILAGLSEAGWSGVGVEPNAKMAEFARNTLKLDVRVGPFELFEDDALFDAVTMIQVLPHFFDPRRALERAARLLRPGGLLLIETWNRGSWTSRLLGKHWHEYSPPSVLHWFDDHGVIRFLRRFGFSWVEQGRPSKKIRGSHARSLLVHSAHGSVLAPVVEACARVIPESAVLPYPAEDLLWLLFRKES